MKEHGDARRDPLASFVLLAYNQEGIVHEAVEAALAQTYQPLEIVLSDDCSADRTFAVMEKIANGYSGPHQIVLNRNPSNLGIVGHINRAFELSSGELLVTAAGDDASLPCRVEDTVDLWLKFGRRPDGLAFGWEDRESGDRWCPPTSAALTIDTIINGGTTNIRGASAAWTRRLLEYWGPLPEGGLSEDRILAFRAMLRGGLLSSPKPVVIYNKPKSRNQLSGHFRLAHRLWNLKRNLRFYEDYQNDTRMLKMRQPEQEDSLERIEVRLRNNCSRLRKEIRYLDENSRLAGVLYTLALLTGRTWTKGNIRSRLKMAATAFRRLAIENRQIEAYDECHHHGGRNR